MERENCYCTVLNWLSCPQLERFSFDLETKRGELNGKALVGSANIQQPTHMSY